MLVKTPKAALNFGLNVPGKLTRTGWQLPKELNEEEWLRCGVALEQIEGAVQWWLGDWWAYGEQRKWGDGEKVAAELGVNYGTIRTYASVARAFELSIRIDNLSFGHHQCSMAASESRRGWWLAQAEKKSWSVNELKSAIAQGTAFQKTKAVEFDAKKIGKYAVLYADPPWRYENPPMGGSNRSIENQYPTMELDEICALPVGEIAHANAVLFLWATTPKTYECMKVLDAWGFVYRTNMVWVKDKIGMGYHVRGQHELLLIAKRGELPPPAADDRPASVLNAPRLEHSAKPKEMYLIIDRMYPDIRKIELFSREKIKRKGWSHWGNQK